MPRTIKADGRTITVPDDATPEEINQIVGPAPSKPPTPEKKGFWQQYDEKVAPLVTPTPHNMKSLLPGKNGQYDAKSYGKEGATVLSNMGAGALGVLLHPVDTAAGIGKTALEVGTGGAVDFGVRKGIADSLTKQPLETAETMAGQTAALGGVGEAAKGAVKSIPKVAGRVTEAVTKTGPKETANLVKETRAANEAELAKAGEKNAKQNAERKIDLKKHFEKTKAVKEANVQAEAPASRRVALERGVEHLEPEITAELEKTAKGVNAIANSKYNALVSVLKDEEAGPYQAMDEEGHVSGEPETITEHLYNVASEPLRGTETESAIIKSLGKRTETGETTLTYNDLQGYREEVGKELRKGTLAPDTYTAYKRLMPEIDRAMQEIAERKGLGKAQLDARNYYRQYAETFLDRDSAVRKAIDTGSSLQRKPGDIVGALRGKSPAIEALAKYSPELARRINTTTGYQGEAKGISAKPKVLKSLPKLEPKSEPIQPELKTIGAEDIRNTKRESALGRAEKIRRPGAPIVSSIAAYDAIRSAMQGEWGRVGLDVAARGIYGAGKYGIARLLQNESVLKLITEPTAQDIAQIPPDLRGNLGPLLEEAQKQGIKIDPRLYAAAGAAAPKKRPGDILPKVQ